MKRNPIRPLFAAALSAALLCMNAYAFTPETVETPSEPIVEDENAALTEVTSELLFYQDFDNIPVGTYESGDIASLLSGTEANKLVDRHDLQGVRRLVRQQRLKVRRYVLQLQVPGFDRLQDLKQCGLFCTGRYVCRRYRRRQDR